MPPIPSDITDLPCILSRRRLRTKLCFEEEKVSPQICGSGKYVLPLITEDFSIETRKVSTSTKRPLGDVESTLQEGTPVCKKRRSLELPFNDTVTSHETASPVSAIIRAVERLTTETDLVADGSRDNVLPTIQGKHRDLKAISPQTMSDVVNGVYSDKLDKVTIIDCRYPYEFNGGHIQGAINIYARDAMQTFLDEAATSHENHVLIFHCEFSSERAPKMYRHLRSLDRELNRDYYPRLNFPEIYLLEGGYKAFFQLHQDQCFPPTYKPMLHEEHSNDLRHFRKKSKSWAAGDKPRHRARVGNGLKLSF